jgi:hypothetical protein
MAMSHLALARHGHAMPVLAPSSPYHVLCLNTFISLFDYLQSKERTPSLCSYVTLAFGCLTPGERSKRKFRNIESKGVEELGIFCICSICRGIGTIDATHGSLDCVEVGEVDIFWIE